MRMIYKDGQALVDELRESDVAPQGVAVWHLGQVAVAVKGPADAGVVVVDPYLTYEIEARDPTTEFVREFRPPLEPSGLVGATAVLVTHNHGDHLDLATLRPLHDASPETVFVVPAPHVALLADAGIAPERVRAARDGERLDLGGFVVEPVAEAHTAYETDARGDHLYLGYLITVDGVRLYHAGDAVAETRLLERVKAFKPDIAFLPINGADYARTSRGIVGNMSGREAVDFAVAVGADLLVPTHYDLFPNNRDNPAVVVDYLFRTYRAQKFHMMAPGERLLYVKSPVEE